MSVQFVNRLAATTALVSAVALFPAGALAQTVINTAVTTTQATNTIVGGYSVTTGGSVNVSGNHAINFNSSNTIPGNENQLTTAVGTTVTSAYGATINTSSLGVDFAITNNGTISNTNGTPVVMNLTSGYGGTLVNNGTITGALGLGNGNNTVTLGATSVTTGNMNMGNGTNNFNMASGAVLNGTLTGGTGADNLVINGGSVGAIDLGAGSNTINFAGDFTLGSSVTYGGAISVTGAGTDVILNAALDGTSTVNIASDTTMTANTGFTTSGAFTLNGNLIIGVNDTVTANSMAAPAGANSVLTFNVGTSTAGQFAVASGTSNFATTDIDVAIADGTFIADGTTYTIVNGVAATTAGTLLNSELGLYNFALSSADSGNDTVLTITRDALDSVVTSGDAGAVAGVLEDLGLGGNSDIDSVVGEISTLEGDALNNAVDSLLPTVNGNVFNTIIENQNTVLSDLGDRLADLRTGMAAGGSAVDRHLWVKGFGQSAEHDGNKGNRGYESDTVGVTVGVDKDIKDGNYGFAFTYADSGVDADSASNASTDISSYQVSAYGTRGLKDGMFMNWMGSLAYNDIETQRVINVGGFDRSVDGDTHGMQLSAKAEVGKDFKHGSAILTPLAGVQYTVIKNKDYTETGAGGASLQVEQDVMNIFNLSTGLRSTWEHTTAAGTKITPSLSGMLQYNLGDNSADVTSQFTGGGAAFETSGVEMNRFGINLGGAIDFALTNGVDLSLSYDADLRRDYTSHNAFVKAKWAF